MTAIALVRHAGVIHHTPLPRFFAVGRNACTGYGPIRSRRCMAGLTSFHGRVGHRMADFRQATRLSTVVTTCTIGVGSGQRRMIESAFRPEGLEGCGCRGRGYRTGCGCEMASLAGSRRR